MRPNLLDNLFNQNFPGTKIDVSRQQKILFYEKNKKKSGTWVGGMVVVVAVLVVGVTVVAIIVVVGPDGACSLYARPLFLACMTCTCLYVLPFSRTTKKFNAPHVVLRLRPSFAGHKWTPRSHKAQSGEGVRTGSRVSLGVGVIGVVVAWGGGGEAGGGSGSCGWC